MPGQNFITGPPNPRGKIRHTLDGKTPIEDQKESWLKYTGLVWMVENPKAPAWIPSAANLAIFALSS